MIQHPEVDGPFSVPSAWSTILFEGVQTPVATAFNGNRWNVTPGFYAAHEAALDPYRVEPVRFARVFGVNLQDPSDPSGTIALAFPDNATAEAVLKGCGAKEPLS